MKMKHEHFEYLRGLVNHALASCVGNQGDIGEAMRYSLLAGGKRIRPVLVLEFCRLCCGDPMPALAQACAVECIHTYSLIHDDLPCMDNDEMRRGRPTNHMVYGEDMALLAGDALLNLAFELCLTPCGDRSETAIFAARELALASGTEGMIGGQALDIQNTGITAEEKYLDHINSLKTGALLRASARMGCIMGGGNQAQLEAATVYADRIGRAFQIRDDLLDAAGNSAQTGKNAGSDSRKDKQTYVSIAGENGCMELIRKLTKQAKSALVVFEDTEFLMGLAEHLAERQN